MLFISSTYTYLFLSSSPPSFISPTVPPLSFSGVSRNFIRNTDKSVSDYLEIRSTFDSKATAIGKRKMFYEQLKRERVERYCLRLQNRGDNGDVGDNDDNSVVSVESSVVKTIENSVRSRENSITTIGTATNSVTTIESSAKRNNIIKTVKRKSVELTKTPKRNSLPKIENKMDNKKDSKTDSKIENKTENKVETEIENDSLSLISGVESAVQSLESMVLVPFIGQGDSVAVETNVRIVYIKPALRYGWNLDRTYMLANPKKYYGTDKQSYYNEQLKERSEEPFFYSPEEDLLVVKIQSRYGIFKTKREIKRMIFKEPIQGLISKVIDRCRKIGSIGYQNEGLTVLQLLRRAGCFNVADAIEMFYHVKYPSNIIMSTNHTGRNMTGRSMKGNNSSKNINNGNSGNNGNDSADDASVMTKDHSSPKKDKERPSTTKDKERSSSSKNKELSSPSKTNSTKNMKDTVRGNDSDREGGDRDENDKEDLTLNKSPGPSTNTPQSTTPKDTSRDSMTSTTKDNVKDNTKEGGKDATRDTQSRGKSRQKTPTMTYEKAIAKLTFEFIVTLPASKYDSVGVTDTNSVRALRDLQAWWGKTSSGSRVVSMNLLNYYSSPYDERTLQQCINDSQNNIIEKFIKAFPSGQSRTREACKILTMSLFPISRRQLDCYIKKYGDKVDLARVSKTIIIILNNNNTLMSNIASRVGTFVLFCFITLFFF